MALQWRQIWVIFHRDALNCEGTIVNMTVSSNLCREIFQNQPGNHSRGAC
jgi:hypothetical protein